MTTDAEPQLPLNGYVKDSLERYFNDLGDHPPANLYQLLMAEVEKPLLETVMQHAQGNQTKASTILGINRGTLRKKLKQYGLDN